MIRKTFIYLTLGVGATLMATNLDEFFSTKDHDITDAILTEKTILEKKVESLEKANRLKEIEIEHKMTRQADMAPTVYFKQPKIYTIYTREELRSWGDIDVVFSSGWKTVVVGKHRLVLNNEMKIK